MKIITSVSLFLVTCSTSFAQSNNLYSSQYKTPMVSSLSSVNQMYSTSQSSSKNNGNGYGNNGNNGNGNTGAGYGNGGPYNSDYGSPTNGNNGNGQGHGNPNGYQDQPNGPWSDNNPNNPSHPAHPCNRNNKNFPNDGCNVQAPNVPLNDHIGLLMLAGGSVAAWMMYKRKQENSNVDAI